MSVTQEMNVSNLDLPDSITDGFQCIRFGEWQIVINGSCVTTFYGDEIGASKEYYGWLQDMRDDPIIDLETPFDELPDSYFKNGYIPKITPLAAGLNLAAAEKQDFFGPGPFDDEDLNQYAKALLSMGLEPAETQAIIEELETKGNSWAG